MSINSKGFRAIAREKLKGKWWLAVGVSLVAGLLGGLAGSGDSGGAGSLGGSADSINSVLSGPVAVALLAIGSILVMWAVVTFFIGPAVELGHSQFYLNLCRGKYVSFSVLFSKFESFWKAFALNFMTGLFTLLWALLLIVPGIIASYRYSMAMFILADNPEIGVMAAISESKRMMQGHKMKLFMLNLSFIGWALLCALTLGIGAIFLTPYMSAAKAAFYLEASKGSEKPLGETGN